MPSVVAATMPPSTVQPMVERAIPLAPVASANGTTPKINASDVITIGRRRSFTACKVAGNNAIPLSTLSLANSTIRIPFLVIRPISIMIPISLKILID